MTQRTLHPDKIVPTDGGRWTFQVFAGGHTLRSSFCYPNAEKAVKAMADLCGLDPSAIMPQHSGMTST